VVSTSCILFLVFANMTESHSLPALSTVLLHQIISRSSVLNPQIHFRNVQPPHPAPNHRSQAVLLLQSQSLRNKTRHRCNKQQETRHINTPRSPSMHHQPILHCLFISLAWLLFALPVRIPTKSACVQGEGVYSTTHNSAITLIAVGPNMKCPKVKVLPRR